MSIQVHRADYQDIMALRDLYRQEANCQIIHDSVLSRGLADAYLILADGHVADYGGVWTKYNPNRLMEFYTLRPMRAFAQSMFRELLAVSHATHIEAQTNMPLMRLMLYDCAKNITVESVLFEDAFTTNLLYTDAIFRRLTPEDKASLFPQSDEPPGDWVIEANGTIVATGGYLTHYNPPYGDIYMEVSEPARRQGFGSYLVQELKRVCYEAGKKPAARCNPANIASRLTLQKAGFLPCGHLLIGEVNL